MKNPFSSSAPKLRTVAAQLLGLRQDEERVVIYLLLHYFLQVFGLALLFIVANTLFLSTFTVQNLPQVFLLGAALMLVGGRIYAWMEHHVALRRVLLGVTATLLLATIFFRLSFPLLDSWWLPIAFLAAYRLLYLLGKLEFWGLAAVVFDVRQARRLFGVISVGDIPAKLLGYLTVAALVPIIGLNNLLWIAAAVFAMGIFLLRSMLRENILPEAHHHDHHEPAHYRQSFWRKWFGNGFIVSMALLSVLGVATLTFVEYAFLAEVDMAFSDEEALASFFAIFFASSYGIIILLKLFVTHRLLNRIGLNGTLLALPVVVALLAGAMVVGQLFTSTETLLLVGFALLMLMGQILSKGIYEPMALVLFQPLQQHLRLKGHTVTKSLMEPLGLGLVGLSLLLGRQFGSGIDLYSLGVVVLILGSVWVGSTVYASRLYFKTLISSIRSRFMEGDEGLAMDHRAVALLKGKLQSPDPSEVIYSVQLLQETMPVEVPGMLKDLITHPAGEVRTYALQQMAERQQQVPVEDLAACAGEERSIQEQLAALQALAVQQQEVNQLLLPLLDHSEPLLRKEALYLLLKRGDLEGMIAAGEKLLVLKAAGSTAEKAEVAEVIGRLQVQSFYRPLVELLEREEDEVLAQALLAAGQVGHPRLLPSVLNFITHEQHWRSALQALGSFCERGLRALELWLDQQSNQPSLTFLRQAVRTAEMVGGEAAWHLLDKLASFPQVEVQDAALEGLQRLVKRNEPVQSSDLWQRLEYEMDFLDTLHRQQAVEEHLLLLAQALEQEEQCTVNRILTLLGILTDHDKVARATYALRKGNREKQANAVEMLEELLNHRPLRRRLLQLLEHHFLHQHKQAPTMVQMGEAVVGEVLKGNSSRYSRYTLALALNEAAGRDWHPHLIDAYTNHPDPLLREVALESAGDVHEPITGETTTMKSVQAPQTMLALEKIMALKNTTLFADTPDSILAELVTIVTEERLPRGETLFREGDIGDSLYVIHSGTISIHRGSLELARFGKNDFFGELALIDPEPRSASATAVEDSFLLRISEEDFADLTDERPEVAWGLLRILVKRLRDQNQRLVELIGKEKANVQQDKVKSV